ncbi:transglycosylase SLT domain-containing protein [Nocardioides sp. YIM 152588]|uniref:aggregation-promoting factor C-terminal-like domain-containing protein n=1 Tax=Nocardioides sp. YIM 152588 TaxID=3158259 RepID=UPI0032E5166B
MRGPGGLRAVVPLLAASALTAGGCTVDVEPLDTSTIGPSAGASAGPSAGSATESSTGSSGTATAGSSTGATARTEGSRARDGQRKERRTGAAGKVPDAVILEELRRTAERIAQRLPSATPTVLPTDVDASTNRGLGYRLMLDFGFEEAQWRYLDALWRRESGWNHLAENPRSGAYGIPQSLPATKMAVVGDDWRTNPETQIRWGLAYIAARYGSPQAAWAHSERTGWY